MSKGLRESSLIERKMGFLTAETAVTRMFVTDLHYDGLVIYSPVQARLIAQGMAKILIVDDEPIVHRLLQHHLERAGYELLAATNGREAIELAAREGPQLIVMDVMMAEMDGLTALRCLKKDDDTKGIPVIMITANSHSVTRQESEAAGASFFLTKPFSPNQLLSEIRRLIPEKSV